MRQVKKACIGSIFKRCISLVLAVSFLIVAMVDSDEASAIEMPFDQGYEVASCKYSVTDHARYNADVKMASMRGTAAPSKPYPYSSRFGSCVERNWTFANCAGTDMMTTCASRVAKLCCH